MKPHLLLLAALAASSLLAVAQPSSKLPDPWLVTGEEPGQYAAGVDADGSITGTPGAKYLRHVRGDGESWATLMQYFSAKEYRGKRVRLEADVKTRDVTGWSGVWLRIDNAKRYNASFYNTQDDPISGNSEWVHRTIVLQSDDDARTINFGVIGGGTGETWIRNVAFEVVPDDVPLSAWKGAKLREAPTP